MSDPRTILIGVIGLTVFLTLYQVVLYPFVLALVARRSQRSSRGLKEPEPPTLRSAVPLPRVTVCVVAHNAREHIEGCLRALLESEYPEDHLEVVVVSDASTDGTDEAVLASGDPRVSLIRMPVRKGKTYAENRVAPTLRGDLIVNTDATVLLEPGAIPALVAAFADDRVGAASGLDVLASRRLDPESKYVNFEMWLRTLETAAGGIIGNSGSIYAVRRHIHALTVPDHLSRDLASAFLTHEAGYRSVFVPTARCRIPPTASVRAEYHRKVRTSMRGMQTLWHFRRLLLPWKHGLFSYKLWSHKVVRWALPPLVLVLGPVTAALAMGVAPPLGWALGGLWKALIIFSIFAIVAGERLQLPKGALTTAYLGAGILAGTTAWGRVMIARGDGSWNPTPRKPVTEVD